MNISLNWANYALIVGVCLIVYYLIIGFLYFRKEFANLFQSKENGRLHLANEQDPLDIGNERYQDVIASDSQVTAENFPNDDNQPYAPSSVQDFVDEINAYTEAWGKETNKEELQEGLRKILYKYPSLKESSIRNILNGIIATASENSCSIHWSEDELNELWNG